MQIDKDKFLFLYSNEYGPLTPSQTDGLNFLLTALSADASMQDPRWGAYCLATVKWECGNTWQPIAEYSAGKGRPYGVPDPATGLVYYGRGFVQLTWLDNYTEMQRATGAALVAHPELAMQPDVAYLVMSHGMRHGSFTGVGLSRFINVEKCDYLNARKIINGLDKAELIAGFAVKIEGMLKECMV